MASCLRSTRGASAAAAFLGRGSSFLDGTVRDQMVRLDGGYPVSELPRPAFGLKATTQSILLRVCCTCCVHRPRPVRFHELLT